MPPSLAHTPEQARGHGLYMVEIASNAAGREEGCHYNGLGFVGGHAHHMAAIGHRKRTIRDIDVDGKRVFVRVDFNVPLDKTTGHITDDSRIRAALPTIRYLLNHGAALILASHLGRPKGKPVASMSLNPVAERLSELLGVPLKLAPDSVGSEVESLATTLARGQVLLLENLRFHPEEEADDPKFALQLATLADVYVNDAFGAAHRAHASTAAIAKYLPAVSGLLMESEIEALGTILHGAEHPLAAVIGGAKISSKIGVLEHLLDVADEFLIGGGMANTLLKAGGVEVGTSLEEDDKLEVARSFLRAARERGREVYLPTDVVIVQSVNAPDTARTASANAVPSGWSIVDIGPETIELYGGALSRAATVVWNGPMGIFEIEAYSRGTIAVARALAASKAKTVVGGGDSVAAVEQAGLSDRMYHVSTGGGASLEFLEGRELPGVAALQDAGGED
jgi:phosphoglycerate kinase